jgi:hypothetical protein
MCSISVSLSAILLWARYGIIFQVLPYICQFSLAPSWRYCMPTFLQKRNVREQSSEHDPIRGCTDEEPVWCAWTTPYSDCSVLSCFIGRHGLPHAMDALCISNTTCKPTCKKWELQPEEKVLITGVQRGSPEGSLGTQSAKKPWRCTALVKGFSFGPYTLTDSFLPESMTPCICIRKHTSNDHHHETIGLITCHCSLHMRLSVSRWCRLSFFDSAPPRGMGRTHYTTPKNQQLPNKPPLDCRRIPCSVDED